MKTLKKTLSLTLVFALVFSLMSFAFAADTTTTTTKTTGYTDAASITYKEAVAVTSAIGVFQGNDSNAFAPKDNLTREQAAKIITYLSIGKTAADALKVSAAPFSDVPADRWSAGSIAYCKQQGIVAGYGDGKFGATDTVTGYQFAKMLLVALDYDATIEGFTGANWSINVAKRGFENDLFNKNIQFNGNAAATREEAALYALNTLLAYPVTYESKGTTITSNGVSVVTGATPARHGAKRFAEIHFPALNGVVATNDLVGNPARIWSYNNVPVGTYPSATTAIAYTAQTSALKVAQDLQNYTFDTTVTEYVNGYSAAFTTKTAAAVAGLTGDGRVVNIYAEKGVIYRIVVVNNLLAKVTAVNATKGTVTYTLLADGTYVTGAAAATTTLGSGSFKVGDYALVTPIGSAATIASSANLVGIASVAAPKVVTGKATSVSTSDGTITVNGTAYPASVNIYASMNVAHFTASAQYDATLLLDANGYIVAAKPGVTSTNPYVLGVTKVYGKVGTDGTYTPVLDAVKSDGTTVTLPYSGTATRGDIVAVTGPASNGLYPVAAAASTTADTKAAAEAKGYVYETVSSLLATEKSYTASFDSSVTQEYYFASNVKFIYVASNGTYTVLDGVHAINSATNVTFALYDVGAAKGQASDIQIVAAYIQGNAPASATDTKSIVYVDGAKTGSTIYTDGTTGYFYDAYIDGEAVKDFSSDTGTNANPGFFVLSQNAATKSYSLATPFTTNTKVAAIENKSSGITFSATNAILNENSVAYTLGGAKIVDTTGKGLVSNADTLAAMIADTAHYTTTVSFLYDVTTNNILYLYVTYTAV